MARTDARTARVLALVVALAAGLGACGADAPVFDDAAQAPPAAEEVTYGDDGFVAVGSPAPDFALPGATRYGVLAEPVRLSDYRGKTVVLAFFFRARGRG